MYGGTARTFRLVFNPININAYKKIDPNMLGMQIFFCGLKPYQNVI